MSANQHNAWRYRDYQPMITELDGPLPDQIVQCESCRVEFIPPLYMRRCSNCQAERAETEIGMLRAQVHRIQRRHA